MDDRKGLRLGALALVLLASVAAACGNAAGTSLRDGGTDAPAEGDAASESGDDGSSTGDDGNAYLTGDGGVYSSGDAPQTAPDGCALLNVACLMDKDCCSGMCSPTRICTMTSHP